MKPRTKTLTPELLHKMDAYWRAANYLSVGQIHLYDKFLNPVGGGRVVAFGEPLERGEKCFLCFSRFLAPRKGT